MTEGRWTPAPKGDKSALGGEKRLMPEFADALRTADEKIGQGAEKLEDGDEDDPDDFGIIGGGFVFDAADQGGNPDDRT